MKIYHGCTSRPKLRKVSTKYASVADHGVMWTVDNMTPTAIPWALDNGAYAAYQNDTEWSPERWRETIERAQRLINEEQMPRPDFAVVPDMVGNADTTYRRSERFVDEIPDAWSSYFAVQDGMCVETACDFAQTLGCDGVFVGGSVEWKRDNAAAYVAEAHSRGMKCHVARPTLPKGLLWADEIGADSVDTTSMVRNQEYRYLDMLRTQKGLAYEYGCGD